MASAMSSYELIYFDQAATSYPKSQAVKESVLRSLTTGVGNPGRSAHKEAKDAAEAVYEARCAVCRFFGATDESRVVFTQNATTALNMAIHAICASGGHVLCSDIEHNAVLRPLAYLAREGKIRFDIFPSRGITADLLERYVRADTCAIVTTHASNVCGRVLPLEIIGDFCRKRSILFIVDASQSAGHLPIDVQRMKIDILCAPAHKGLYGILGAGFAIFETQRELPPLLHGGSGTESFSPYMPKALPERFEAGSLSVPAITALGTSLKEIEAVGVKTIAAHIASIEKYLRQELASFPALSLSKESGCGILSLTHERFSPSRMADALDEVGVATRAGYHCAPLAHKTLGTDKTGSLRLSLGATNTKAECAAFCERFSAVLKKLS